MFLAIEVLRDNSKLRSILTVKEKINLLKETLEDTQKNGINLDDKHKLEIYPQSFLNCV